MPAPRRPRNLRCVEAGAPPNPVWTRERPTAYDAPIAPIGRAGTEGGDMDDRVTLFGDVGDPASDVAKAEVLLPGEGAEPSVYYC